MDYVISVTLDQECVKAKNDEEALNKAKDMVKNGMYNLMIVDKGGLE